MAMVPQPSSKDTPFHHSVVFNRVCRPFPRIFLIEGGSRISNAAFPCLSSLSPVTRILVRFPNYIVCNSRGWGPWLLLSPYPIPNGSNPIWSSLSIFAIKVFSRGILGWIAIPNLGNGESGNAADWPWEDRLSCWVSVFLEHTPAQLDWVRQRLIKIHEFWVQAARASVLESRDSVALQPKVAFHLWNDLEFDSKI